jgi:hypothetical protein
LSKNSKVGPASANILETDLDGEVSLYNPIEEQVTILNGTASDVWYLCDGTMTVDDIVGTLASSYQVDGGHIRDDVVATIDRLNEAGLLQK